MSAFQSCVHGINRPDPGRGSGVRRGLRGFAGRAFAWTAPRSRRRAIAIAAIASCLSLGTSVHAAAPAAAAGTGANVVLQSMDSCKRALGGGTFALQGGTLSKPIFESPASHSTTQVSSSTTCPLQQGDCATMTVGCVTFPNVPPGTYTIKWSKSAPTNPSNPGGYAACTGGSACRSEVVNLTVHGDNSVTAQTSNVYPDNTTAVWPTGSSYAATSADPAVFHSFGLALDATTDSCDHDADADDFLTGAPSGECAYAPESGESSACKPFPWSCSIVVVGTSTLTSTSTSVATSASSVAAGQPVTYTATVSPSSGPVLPTGTIVFSDAGVNIAGCSAVAVTRAAQAACTASFPTTSGSPHTITAAYSGDTTYAGSTGKATQTVTAIAPTTVVSSSANPVTAGAPVTYTASVTPAAATGVVAFHDGNTVISGCGSVGINAGQAACTPPAYTTAAGSPRQITATYAGDSTYATSTSAVLPETVVILAPVVVAVRGADQALWVNIAGQGYVNYGGRLTAAPAAASLGGGNHLYIVAGDDHQLYQRTDHLGYQPAAPAGTYCLDDPAVYVPGSGTITGTTLGCVGSDHQLFVNHGSVDGSGVFHFGAWVAEGGYLNSGPSIGLVNNVLHYFVEGANHAEYDRTDVTGYSRTPWSCIGQSAVSNFGGEAYFTCHGTDDQAWIAVNTGTGWGNAQPLGGRIVDGPSVAAYAGGATVAVAGVDGSPYTIEVDPTVTVVVTWFSLGGQCLLGPATAVK